MLPIHLPVETDESIIVKAYRDRRRIRICFINEGGFITAGLFRAAILKTPEEQSVCNGPVSVSVTYKKGENVELAVAIDMKDRKVSKTLTAEVCDELNERVDQASAILHSYEREALPE